MDSVFAPSLLMDVQIVSAASMAGAYFVMAGLSVALVRRREVASLRLVRLAFVAFFIVCGLMHLAGVGSAGASRGWAETGLQIVAALASIVAATALWLARRTRTTSPTRAQLEDSVRQRTSELGQINERLTSEVEHRRSTEAALRRAIKLQGSILATSLDAIVTIDHQGRILEFNAAAERIFGHRAADVTGQAMSALIVPERLRERHQQGFERHLRTGEARVLGQRIEIEALRADGVEIPVELALTRLPDEEPPIFTAFVRDVSERRSTEHALRSSEAKLSGIVQSALDAIVTVDARQCVVLFNRAAETTFGYPAADAIGKPVATFIPELAAIGGTRQLGHFGAAAKDAREGGINDIVIGRRFDGTEFPMEASISAVEVDGERLSTVIVRDVTERIRSEQRIRELNEDLEARVHRRTEQLSVTVRELEAFSYTVSHDLRAPLRAIDGFTNILLEDHDARLDPIGRDLLRRVSRNARQMGRLIDGLLEFSRLGRAEIKSADIDLQALVQSVIEEVACQHAHAVQVTCAKLPTVHGDELLLRQVWTNLIGNAFKFTAHKAGAHVRIEASADRQPVFSVRDNGVGFDMAHSDKLFGVFQRLHAGTQFEGTGVGLAIVRRIVERHGGRIWVDSAPGQGAQFSFVLGPE